MAFKNTRLPHSRRKKCWENLELNPILLDSLDHPQLPLTPIFTTCVYNSPGDYISQLPFVISPPLLYTVLISRPRTSLQVENLFYKYLGTTEFHFPFLVLTIKPGVQENSSSCQMSFQLLLRFSSLLCKFLSTLKTNFAFVLQAALA